MLFRIRLNCYPDLYPERNYFTADPDPTFHFDAYPDSDPAPFFLPIRIRILIKVMRIWNTGLQTIHGSRIASTAPLLILGSLAPLEAFTAPFGPPMKASMAPLWAAPQLSAFHFNEDPDPGFSLCDKDPNTDPAPQNDADLCGPGSATLNKQMGRYFNDDILSRMVN